MNTQANIKSESHPFLKSKLGHIINGQFVEGATGALLDCVNPANGQVLARLPEGNGSDMDKAVKAARKAFNGAWSRWTPYQRQVLLTRIHDLVAENFEEIARLATLEIGTPLARTRQMKDYALSAILYYATQTVNVAGQILPNNLTGEYMTMTIKAPLGVVGAIMPWNVPLVGAWYLIGGTLASGCTLVLKPAEHASLVVLYLTQLLYQAGMPEGVVNVVTGNGPTAGAALAGHPDVDRIIFTGSTESGRRVIEASASNVKRVQLELGGKSPDVVFADADLDAAVPGAAMGVFFNSGQACIAGSRLFVQRSIHDQFVERLTEFAKQLRVGDGLDLNVDLGPVISQRQLDRVLSYIEGAQKEGATLSSGGSRLGGHLGNGFFVRPTVFSNVTADMTIAKEEIFGPVISVLPFESTEDALEMANATEYGLAGAVWTRDISKAMKMVHGIKAGTLWVNCYGVLDAGVGMNGHKLSGYGAKGGPSHIDAFLYQKSVYINHAG